jgi:hypothetical protein
MALAVGLYLFDSALLLYADEGVLAAAGAGRWRLGFGSAVLLLGRGLYLPQPLAPHRPLFRLRWSVPRRAGAADPGDWTARRALLAPLAPLVWGAALGLFVLLPLGLYTRLGDAALLGALGLTYASILAAIAWLVHARRRAGLSWLRVARLAFESLVCPPLALNLVRKLSAEPHVAEDLVCAARRLLPPGAWPEARRAFVARVEDEIGLEADEDTPRARALRCYRDELLAEPEALP